MSFGENLRELIEERNMTQKELAVQLNIAPSTMGSYVQNTREPDFDTLKLFAKYFDVTTDYLLDFHSSKTDTHEEDNLLRIFRSLSEEQKELYLEQGKIFIRLNKRKAKTKKS